MSRNRNGRKAKNRRQPHHPIEPQRVALPQVTPPPQGALAVLHRGGGDIVCAPPSIGDTLVDFIEDGRFCGPLAVAPEPGIVRWIRVGADFFGLHAAPGRGYSVGHNEDDTWVMQPTFDEAVFELAGLVHRWAAVPAIATPGA